MQMIKGNRTSSSTTKIAILGGGNAGRGLAGYMALHGLDVALYNRTLENVRGIIDRGGLDVHGVIEGYAQIPLVTNNMAKAIRNREILIVTVPAQAHEFFAHKMAPYLDDGQLVLLMPGRTGGALEFAHIIESNPNTQNILLGEAQTFSFVSRMTGISSVKVSKIKNLVRVSAFPASASQEFLKRLKGLPLTLELANDVMETGLNNVGAMLHPTPTILCAGLLESRRGGYNHYHDAISESVGRLIERMDAERVNVASQFSPYPMTLLEWLEDTYDAEGNSLRECIQSIDAYDGVGSPGSLQHRYVLEDIPTGLVPISNLGDLCGVETPAIDAVIEMACQLYECDFRRTGRSLASMGLVGMNPQEVAEYVELGVRPAEWSSFPSIYDLYEVEVDET
jgi:opine dehydrogenase